MVNTHSLQGFIHPGWCRISAINSSISTRLDSHSEVKLKVEKQMAAVKAKVQFKPQSCQCGRLEDLCF